jgi:hypothetical protein
MTLFADDIITCTENSRLLQKLREYIHRMFKLA